MTEPHHFWQRFHPAADFEGHDRFTGAYPAIWADTCLVLPIRPLAGTPNALASLIVNQASFAVQDRLAQDLADKLRHAAPDIVIGLPTLGLTLASAVARALGHPRYVPLGTSRKFWYRDALSVPLSSITTPGQQKRLYIDPRMLPLLDGKRVVLIDDVISTGTSIVAGLQLLRAIGIEPVAVGAAMLQSDRWRARIAAEGAYPLDKVQGVFQTPLLEACGDGVWMRPTA